MNINDFSFKLFKTSKEIFLYKLNKIYFIFDYISSPNGNYILALNTPRYGDNWTLHGIGEYFLIHENKIITAGMLQFPEDGQVANNGRFIINDNLLPHESGSEFLCFDCNGDIVIHENFSVKIKSIRISNNGNFALLSTLYHSIESNNFEDTNNFDDGFENGYPELEEVKSLFFYDLNKKQLLWEKYIDFVDPIEYSICEETLIINLHYEKSYALRKLGTISLDWNGNIKDREGYFLKYLSTLGTNNLISTCLRALDTTKVNQGILNFLHKALNRNDASPYLKAQGYRFLGELYEIDDIKKAIKYFELALKCNPKVGVKKKLNALMSKIENQKPL